MTDYTQFLSTLPARGATVIPPSSPRKTGISIHAPREGSDAQGRRRPPARRISIHAPREGSDMDEYRYYVDVTDISIHAPREGSDHSYQQGLRRMWSNFYPRSPRGERPGAKPGALYLVIFLSTLPARGATTSSKQISQTAQFLSTLPARGATSGLRAGPLSLQEFLSTLPARGATTVGGFSPYAV